MLSFRGHHAAQVQQADAYMAGARGKDVGVTRIETIVETMGVDGTGEESCVWEEKVQDRLGEQQPSGTEQRPRIHARLTSTESTAGKSLLQLTSSPESCFHTKPGRASTWGTNTHYYLLTQSCPGLAGSSSFQGPGLV